jgi:hypothetical protein
MLFTDDLYLTFTFTLFFHLTLTQALSMQPDSINNNPIPTVNTTINGTVTTVATSIKHRIDQSTIIRGTIVLVGITCLILMYIGIKTFL